MGGRGTAELDACKIRRQDGQLLGMGCDTLNTIGV